MRSRSFLLATLLAVAACAPRGRAGDQPAPPPPLVLGRFADDYGSSFQVSATLFEQLPRNRFHIIEWNASEQYFLARNDSANSSDQGLWSRIDWMPLSGMDPYTWGFCFTAYRAPTRDAARQTPPANRATPRTGCNGFPFSRMKALP